MVSPGFEAVMASPRESNACPGPTRSALALSAVGVTFPISITVLLALSVPLERAGEG
jgi:hypothetical protein